MADLLLFIIMVQLLYLYYGMKRTPFKPNHDYVK